MTERTLTILTAEREEEAQAIAQELSCSCDDESAEVQLHFAQSALSMSFHCDDEILNNCKPISFSFAAYDMRSKAGGDPRQNLFRACGLQKNKQLRILDCCAGAGGDAFMMHSQGAQILSFERHAIIFQLLQDVLRRELQSEAWVLQHGNAIEYMQQHANLAAAHDVIYIDPMFHGERKRRAAEGRVMRALRFIAGNDEDSEELVSAAAQSNVARVVLKRPLRSQTAQLHGRNCTQSIKGKGHRLDVYM